MKLVCLAAVERNSHWTSSPACRPIAAAKARENRHRGGPALYVSGGIIAFKSALELDLHPAGLEPALAKRLLHADGSVLLKTSTSCGFADLFESNHQLESRVQNVFFALMWCRARKPLA